MLFCIFLSRFASFSCVCSLLSFEYLTLYPCLLSVCVCSYLFGFWRTSTFVSFSDCSLEVSNTLDFCKRFLAYACLLFSILSCFYWVVSLEHFTLCLSLLSASLCCVLLILFWEFSFPQPGSSRVSLLLLLVFEICSSFLFNNLISWLWIYRNLAKILDECAYWVHSESSCSMEYEYYHSFHFVGDYNRSCSMADEHTDSFHSDCHHSG